jgi:hypothetical protein
MLIFTAAGADSALSGYERAIGFKDLKAAPSRLPSLFSLLGSVKVGEIFE